MIGKRIRVGMLVVVLTAGVGWLGWGLGLLPEDPTRAQIEHCYVTYDRQEVMTSRCVGTWTRGGHEERGPVIGVGVQPDWQAISEPDSAYWAEVSVPESERHPRVFADARQAWALSARSVPWLVTPLLGGALIMALAWATVAVVPRRRNHATAAGEPEPVSVGQRSADT